MDEIKLRIVYLLRRTDTDDDSETDAYVGSTSSDLRKRLWEHKCETKRCGSKLYKRMREVGIENWEIIPLLSRICDGNTIREVERKWVEILNSDLNSYSPFSGFENKKEYYVNYYRENIQNKVFHCEICDKHRALASRPSAPLET